MMLKLSSGHGIVWLHGRVGEAVERTQGLQELEVYYGKEKGPALNFIGLTGEANTGDEVVVNATARVLGLGSGGYDFVALVIKSPVRGEVGAPSEEAETGVNAPKFPGREQGHVMKLRYTPLQFRCLAVEEEASGQRDAVERTDLEGMPVLVGELHSQVAPAVAGIWSRLHGSGIAPRVTYIMPDGGALPLAISRTVGFLKEKGLVGTTITCGHAFGGDLECVNVYSALVAARHVSRADAAVVCIGPGIVGTGTSLGTTAISQGEAINAAFALGGKPIAIPRIGFADARKRHYGLSHHTVTVLKKVIYPPCIVGLPRVAGASLAPILKVICGEGLHRKYLFVFANGVRGVGLLRNMGFVMESMGRSYESEPLLFEAAAACGDVAGNLILTNRRKRPRR